VALVLACGITSAQAGSVSPAIISGNINGAEIETAGTLSGGPCVGSSCLQQTVTLAYSGADGSISANGATEVNNPYNASRGGSITYYFEVVGSGSSVPLTLTANGSTSASGTDANASVTVAAPNGGTGKIEMAIESKRSTAPNLPRGFNLARDVVKPHEAYLVHGGSDSWPMTEASPRSH
jgi:hypothetical protein